MMVFKNSTTVITKPSSIEVFYLNSANKPLKNLAIGAGIAGLSAAVDLQRAGHEVEILPSSSRKGFQ